MTTLPHGGEAFATANGITLCYESFGEVGAPTLLLIGGFSNQMIFWQDALCQQLARSGYRVIRYDNRDVGRSSQMDTRGLPDLPVLWEAKRRDTPLHPPYTLREMVADALGLLDALAVPSAHVVGASLGGWLAQMIATLYPARVQTLTVISSSSHFPLELLPATRPQRPEPKPPPADRAMFIERLLPRLRYLSGPRYPLDDTAERGYIGRLFDRGFYPDGIQRQRAAGWTYPDLRAALRAIPHPALVIHGDADPTIDIRYGIETAQTVPGARLLVLEGMGHQRLPEPVWPQVQQALTELMERVP